MVINNFAKEKGVRVLELTMDNILLITVLKNVRYLIMINKLLSLRTKMPSIDILKRLLRVEVLSEESKLFKTHHTKLKLTEIHQSPL